MVKRSFHGFVIMALSYVLISCDQRPPATFHSGRRIVAIACSKAISNEEIVKYLSGTNTDDLIFETGAEDYIRNYSISVLSSNNVSWKLKFTVNRINGTNYQVEQTEIIELRYPQMKQLKLHGFDSSQAWFLSDEEIFDLDTKFR